MKNTGIMQRAAFSIAGWRRAVGTERSLRAHVALSLAVLLGMAFARPEIVWWAIMLLSIAVGWALELMNAAIERLCDHLHPQHHIVIGEVKDIASAAAFTVNMATGALAAVMFWTTT